MQGPLFTLYMYTVWYPSIGKCVSTVYSTVCEREGNSYLYSIHPNKCHKFWKMFALFCSGALIGIN
jgi:hypothetical protein